MPSVPIIYTHRSVRIHRAAQLIESQYFFEGEQASQHKEKLKRLVPISLNWLKVLISDVTLQS